MVSSIDLLRDDISIFSSGAQKEMPPAGPGRTGPPGKGRRRQARGRSVYFFARSHRNMRGAVGNAKLASEMKKKVAPKKNKDSGYVCSFCNDSRFFFQRIDWRDHMHHKHVHVFYKCETCSYKVKSRSNMLAHVMKKHNRQKNESEKVAHYPDDVKGMDINCVASAFNIIRAFKTNFSDTQEIIQKFADVGTLREFLDEA